MPRLVKNALFKNNDFDNPLFFNGNEEEVAKEKIKMNQKFLEIISNLVMEQKRQLIDIISKEEGLPKDEMYKHYLMSKQDIYNLIGHFACCK